MIDRWAIAGMLIPILICLWGGCTACIGGHCTKCENFKCHATAQQAGVEDK